MDRSDLIIMQFMLDQLERIAGAYDSELRGHIVEASNRLFDLTTPTDKGTDQ